MTPDEKKYLAENTRLAAELGQANTKIAMLGSASALSEQQVQNLTLELAVERGRNATLAAQVGDLETTNAQLRQWVARLEAERARINARPT